jgi:hypothetical protein
VLPEYFHDFHVYSAGVQQVVASGVYCLLLWCHMCNFLYLMSLISCPAVVYSAIYTPTRHTFLLVLVNVSLNLTMRKDTKIIPDASTQELLDFTVVNGSTRSESTARVAFKRAMRLSSVSKYFSQSITENGSAVGRKKTYVQNESEHENVCRMEDSPMYIFRVCYFT